ncbi:MAG: hypothetical protein ACK41O_10265 [Runella zeae]
MTIAPTLDNVSRAINDANLFIDLYEVQLTATFFGLPLVFHTTQLILNELEDEQVAQLQPYIQNGSLYVRHLSREEIESLDALTPHSRKLSRQDLSVYFYAREIGKCMILTGDNRLRKEAQRQGFEVHGILWVLEQMVIEALLTPNDAVTALQNLMLGYLSENVGSC